MADARTTALRNLVDVFGGNPPDWIRAEYDAACAALNTPDPMRDAAPDMLAALLWIGALIEGGEAMPKPTDDVAVSIFSAIAKAEGK